MKKSIKNKKFLTLLKFIFIPLILGFFSGWLSGSNNGYNDFIKPNFAPPGIVFPIIWTILYILMGISSYKIYSSDSLYRNKALLIYWVQLAINLIWSFIFFRFNWFLFAAFIILILIVLVTIMIFMFKKINKFTALLQIPYLFWLIFAFILNVSIYLLN